MVFSDADPIEEDMGVRCEHMSPDQLVAYIKSYHQAFDLDLKVEGMPERAVFRSLQRLYGKENAGLIVKWAFYHHRGRFRDEPIGFFMFSKGNKWWTDKIYLEMQRDRSNAVKRTTTGYSLGVTSLADL